MILQFYEQTTFWCRKHSLNLGRTFKHEFFILTSEYSILNLIFSVSYAKASQ